MRSPLVIAIASVLAGCSTAVEPPTRSAQAEERLQALLAGKVAGPPMACLPSSRGNNMVTIDDNTIAFRAGSRVYVNSMSSGCSNLSGPYALVIRNPVGSLCRGDIAEVADLATGARVGGCVLGDFVPYAKPSSAL